MKPPLAAERHIVSRTVIILTPLPSGSKLTAVLLGVFSSFAVIGCDDRLMVVLVQHTVKGRLPSAAFFDHQGQQCGEPEGVSWHRSCLRAEEAPGVGLVIAAVREQVFNLFLAYLHHRQKAEFSEQLQDEVVSYELFRLWLSILSAGERIVR